MLGTQVGATVLGLMAIVKPISELLKRFLDVDLTNERRVIREECISEAGESLGKTNFVVLTYRGATISTA